MPTIHQDKKIRLMSCVAFTEVQNFGLVSRNCDRQIHLTFEETVM